MASSLLNIRFYLEWLVLRGVVRYIEGGDMDQAWRRTQRLARLGTKIPRHEWHWTLQNLKLVFGPTLTDVQRKRLAAIAFEQHFGSYMEGLRHRDVAVSTVGLDRLQHAYKKGRGVILCSVHLGSWESGGRLLAEAGFPIAVVYRRAFNPLSDREFQRTRASYNVEWIPSDDCPGHGAGIEGKEDSRIDDRPRYRRRRDSRRLSRC